MSASLQRHIVVLVYPEVMAMDVCGPMEAFAMANSLAKDSLYRLSIAAERPIPSKLRSGFVLLNFRYFTGSVTLPVVGLVTSPHCDELGLPNRRQPRPRTVTVNGAPILDR